jgi:hypothetical protein
MNTKRVLIPGAIVLALSLAGLPAGAQQRRGGGGGGGGERGGQNARAHDQGARAVPRQAPAPQAAPRPERGPAAQAPAGGGRAGSYQPRGPAPQRGDGRAYGNGGRGFYAPRTAPSRGRAIAPFRPGYSVRPYYYGRRPYYFARPYYAFRPHFSIGFGIWVGYPVPWPYYDPYGYVYGYPYPYPYPYPAQPYPSYPPSYPYAENGYPAEGSSGATTYGGVSFEITPPNAAIYVDGSYAGTCDQFTANAEPLPLEPGRHRIEIQAQGYRPIVFDAEVVAGQVIPYRGSLQPF